MSSIWKCKTKDENQVKQLVSSGIWVLVMILAEYGSNDNKLRVLEKVD